MNDPNRKIDVNLSSLLSLKAELLRKQSEVNKAKVTRKIEDFVPSKSSSNSSNNKKEDKERNKYSEKDKGHKDCELEDSALLEKSQKVLEAKTKFYDRMTSTGGRLNSDDNCLVMFNRKKQDGPENRKIDSSSDSSNDSCDDNMSDGEDLVEYTDCLGRTRQCPRRNLEFIKKKDSELAASIPERLDQSAPNWMIDTKGASTGTTLPPSESIFGDGSSMMSKHDEMRNNWEKKEEENLTKTDVHYQDVFFDEARQHGVGYYAFSTDEEERARQQKELEETRKRTLSEQEEREKQRAHREKIIAERVLAAKNRQRARLGLPPLETVEVDKNNVDDKPPETKSERKQRKREEKRKRKQEKEDRAREEERKHHIRPWDKNKDGVRKIFKNNSDDEDDKEWQYRPEKTPMSQEQWNEMKRAERCSEFAPQPEKMSRNNLTTFIAPPPPPPFIDPPPQTVFNPFADVSNNFATFQTSKPNFQRRNYKASDDDTLEETTYRRSSGTEIPPPLNLDDNMSHSMRRHQKRSNNDDLEKSIEAGLKYLRNNSDKGTHTTKSSWTSKADY